MKRFYMIYFRMRHRVTSEIKLLETSPPERFVNDAVDCHLRVASSNASTKNRRLCKLCQVHDDIEHYETIIFRFVKSDLREIKAAAAGGVAARDTIDAKEKADLEAKGVILLDEQRKGTWGDSEAERLLKVGTAC